MTYNAENERLMLRTQARTTAYPAKYYELGSVTSDLTESDADVLWNNIRSSNICNAVRAEQNFGYFLRTGYGTWQTRQLIFLQQLDKYLPQISK